MQGTQLNNPNDPLRGSTDKQARELLSRLGQVASGCSNEVVLKAAANFFINVVRQSCKTRRQAELVFDETVGRSKAVLMEHYDSVTGKRKNIFPFTQHINVPFFKDPDGVMER